MHCCAAYMYSSAGYKMARQYCQLSPPPNPHGTLGKFGFTKSIDNRVSQRDIKLPDFAAKMQKTIMHSMCKATVVTR